ncbi:hypothetical protein JL722_12792 [Aureococcus anophagefferens]|nr:hypothetical protein JL722_12792 [Aureococcus anophagefferens]
MDPRAAAARAMAARPQDYVHDPHMWSLIGGDAAPGRAGDPPGGRAPGAAGARGASGAAAGPEPAAPPAAPAARVAPAGDGAPRRDDERTVDDDDDDEESRQQREKDARATGTATPGARDGADLDLVPNTLAAAKRAMAADDDDAARGRRRGRGRPRLITSSARPHVITRANAAFSELCGFSAAEALRLPSSMIVVNYRRDGTKFINYLRVFPLAGDGDGADDFGHYLAELERLDDEAVAAIENAPGPPPPRWHLAPAARRARRPRSGPRRASPRAPAFVPPHIWRLFCAGAVRVDDVEDLARVRVRSSSFALRDGQA